MKDSVASSNVGAFHTTDGIYCKDAVYYRHQGYYTVRGTLLHTRCESRHPAPLPLTQRPGSHSEVLQQEFRTHSSKLPSQISGFA